MGRPYTLFRLMWKKTCSSADQCIGSRCGYCPDDAFVVKPEEIARAVLQGNARQLKASKHWQKSAERNILELRDKIGKIIPETIFPH